MACKICEVRRPRRYCPGVGGEICTVCCGTEREVTVSCPLDCLYLQEARRHEKVPEPNPAEWPNQDIKVTHEFLDTRGSLLDFLAAEVLHSALETQGATDFDVREAFDAMIRTYRTRESGLFYESRPNNLIAGTVQRRLQEAVEKLEKDTRERQGMSVIRDTDVLGILVFLQRLEFQHNNGRKRSRAFIDFLRTYFEEARRAAGLPEAEGQPPLIVP